jgi:hypothetical protein
MNNQFKIFKSHWRRSPHCYDSIVGWWHLPNLTAHLPLGETFHLFRSNTDGMRADRDFPKETPQGRKRIVLLGDSYTAGDGVSNGERFGDLLESYHPRLDTLNFALNGSGTDQQMLIYENFALPYQHDAIVWGICVENIGRNLCTCRPSFDYQEGKVVYRPKPYFTLREGELQPHHQPVPLEVRPDSDLGDWSCYYPYLPGDTDAYAIYRYPEREHWQMMKALLLRLTKSAQRPVILMPLPMNCHYLEQSPPSYMPAFESLHDPARGIHVINVLPALLAQPLTQRRNFEFPNDPHYTAAAHRLIAVELNGRLNEILGENWAGH